MRKNNIEKNEFRNSYNISTGETYSFVLIKLPL